MPEQPAEPVQTRGLCLRLPLKVDDRALAAKLSAHGLTARPLSAYCLQRKDLRGLLDQAKQRMGSGVAAIAAARSAF